MTWATCAQGYDLYTCVLRGCSPFGRATRAWCFLHAQAAPVALRASRSHCICYVARPLTCPHTPTPGHFVNVRERTVGEGLPIPCCPIESCCDGMDCRCAEHALHPCAEAHRSPFGRVTCTSSTALRGAWRIHDTPSHHASCVWGTPGSRDARVRISRLAPAARPTREISGLTRIFHEHQGELWEERAVHCGSIV